MDTEQRSRIPTITEDGIPIRKIYVCNLPTRVNRKQLFRVFTQFGVIQKCWLKPYDYTNRDQKQSSFAFITYFNPEDANKALTAPPYKKRINGQYIRTFVADSWHQPVFESDFAVIDQSKTKHSPACMHHNLTDNEQSTSKSTDPYKTIKCNCGAVQNKFQINEEVISETDSLQDDPPTILDILNRDCLMYMLSFVSLKDMISSERVSKKWQSLIKDYYSSVKEYRTSWWPSHRNNLTTAVLRQILTRIGQSLTRLHINHSWICLNDRTAHSVARFCPNLEEFKVVDMATSNWSPLVQGCSKLKKVHFVYCRKIFDNNLMPLIKATSSIEMIKITGNAGVSGVFLNTPEPIKLTSIEFKSCPSLQSSAISMALQKLPNLTVLKLDDCPGKIWNIIPTVLEKLPNLKRLSLQDYVDGEVFLSTKAEKFEDIKKAFNNLKELKTLKLRDNIYINDDVLKEIAKNCPNLEYLNLNCCNGFPPRFKGVTDKGIKALCASSVQLVRLDLSFVKDVTDAGVGEISRLPQLRHLLLRGNKALSTEALVQFVHTCHKLENLNLSSCTGIEETLLTEAEKELEVHPRPLMIWVGGTSIKDLFAKQIKENDIVVTVIISPIQQTCNKLLTVQLMEDFPKNNWRFGHKDDSPYYDSAEELDLEHLHEIINENPDMIDLLFDNNEDYMSDSDLDEFDELEFYFNDLL